MLGLNNPVPGPSRGMLSRAASIVAVVMRKKRSKESVASCMFANLFSLHEVNFDQKKKKLKCEKDLKHPERYRIVRKTFFPIRGFVQ